MALVQATGYATGYFIIIRIFTDMGLVTGLAIKLTDTELLPVLTIFFCTGYYSSVIIICCIIFNLLVGLSAHFGVFGCYVI